MEQEMEELRKRQSELEALKQEREKAARVKQRQSIVSPGIRQCGIPSKANRKFGL